LLCGHYAEGNYQNKETREDYDKVKRGPLNLDSFTQIKNKCKESKDFNRDFFNLLHKYKISFDLASIHREDEKRQEEKNRKIDKRKKNMKNKRSGLKLLK